MECSGTMRDPEILPTDTPIDPEKDLQTGWEVYSSNATDVSLNVGSFGPPTGVAPDNVSVGPVRHIAADSQ